MNSRKVFAKFLAGNSFYAVSQAAVIYLIIIFSSTDSAGIFSYGLAIAVPINVLFNIGLRSVISSDLERFHSDNAYKLARTLLSLCGLAFCTAVTFFLESDVNIALCIILVALSKSIEGLFDVGYGFMQRDGRQDLIAKSLTLRSIANMGAVFSALIVFDGNIIYVCVAYSLSFIFCYLIENKQYNVDNGRARLKDAFLIISKNYSIGFSSLFTAGFASAPRIVIKEISDYGMLGVYAAVSAAPQFGSILASSLGQAKIVYWAKIKTKSFELKKSVLRVIVINLFFSAAIGGIVFMFYFLAKKINFNLIDPNYYRMTALFFFASAPSYVMNSLGYYMIALNYKKLLLFSQFIRLILVVPLTFLFVTEYGVLGVAGATLISTAMVLSVYFWRIFR